MGLNETGLEALSSITASEFFDVTITGTNSPIQQGDTLTVNYDVTNTGDVTGTQDIALEIDTVVEDTDAGVRVLANRTGDGALEWVTASDETAQDYTASVVSADDSASQTVTVESGSAIPDSVVSRPADDTTRTDSTNVGIVFSTTAGWSKFQARISQNTNTTTSSGNTLDLTETDGSVIQSVDISGLAAGSVVTFDNISLQSGSEYYIINKTTQSRDRGALNNTSYPYTSTDGDLSITDGFFSGSPNNGGAAGAVSEIGNINL